LANRVVVSSANNAATATHPVTVTHQGSLNMYSVCLKIMRLLFDFRTTIQPRVGQRPSCGNNGSSGNGVWASAKESQDSLNEQGLVGGAYVIRALTALTPLTPLTLLTALTTVTI